MTGLPPVAPTPEGSARAADPTGARAPPAGAARGAAGAAGRVRRESSMSLNPSAVFSTALCR